DDRVPGGEAPGLPALPRPPQAPPLRGHGAREVRRLFAVRRRLPRRLHPRRCGREPGRRSPLRRRALRRGVRDQPQPLHLLRLLRGRVPVRRDHDGPRVRDVGLQPQRSHLHEGDAARRAAREGPAPPRRGVTEDPRVALVRAGFEAFARGDIEAMLAVADPEGVLHDPDWTGRTFHGRDGYLEFLTEWMESWDTYTIEVEEYRASDEWVVAVGKQTGRGKGSGIELEGPVIYLLRVEDGLITEL